MLKNSHFLDFSGFLTENPDKRPGWEGFMNYHITRQPSDLCLNTLFFDMILQRAWQLITRLSLTISILYPFLPCFSERINRIAVAVVIIIPIIRIDRKCLKAFYLYKQI